MALTPNQIAITKLYVGAFIRAPEKGGLEYWDGQMASGKSFGEIVSTVFSLPVVKAIYPGTMSNAQFITAVYANVFGKTPDDAGLAYWAAQIGAGQERGAVVTQMIDAGLNTPDGTPGKTYVVNRVEAAKLAAELQLTRGTTVDEHKLIQLLSNIDGTTESYNAGIAAIDKAVAVPFATSGQTTVSATPKTDLFIFAVTDASNFKVINGLQSGDMLNVSLPDQTNGDYSLAAATNSASVAGHGKWYYDAAAQDLTYWNNASAAATKVHLTGVASLTVDANAVFTVG